MGTRCPRRTISDVALLMVSLVYRPQCLWYPLRTLSPLLRVRLAHHVPIAQGTPCAPCAYCLGHTLCTLSPLLRVPPAYLVPIAYGTSSAPFPFAYGTPCEPCPHRSWYAFRTLFRNKGNKGKRLRSKRRHSNSSESDDSSRFLSDSSTSLSNDGSRKRETKQAAPSSPSSPAKPPMIIVDRKEHFRGKSSNNLIDCSRPLPSKC